MPTTRTPKLLVLPGWDDDGQQQFDALHARLRPAGWRCRRAHLPDSSWPAAQRAAATREDTLRQVLADYFALIGHSGIGPIAVLGFSFGAYMAAYLAAARPVDLLVLRCPAIYPDERWHTPKEELDKADLNAYRHRLLTPTDNRALACCAQFTGDVLLVDSECDRVIPPPVIASYAAAFQNARSLTRHTVMSADHTLTDPAWQEDYRERVVAWLAAKVQA